MLRQHEPSQIHRRRGKQRDRGNDLRRTRNPAGVRAILGLRVQRGQRRGLAHQDPEHDGADPLRHHQEVLLLLPREPARARRGRQVRHREDFRVLALQLPGAAGADRRLNQVDRGLHEGARRHFRREKVRHDRVQRVQPRADQQDGGPGEGQFEHFAEDAHGRVDRHRRAREGRGHADGQLQRLQH